MTDLANATTRCSEAYCGMENFLPITCAYCELKFCEHHYMPGDHMCRRQSLADFEDARAELCPDCGTTVKYTKNLKVDEVMRRHREGGECEAGKRLAKVVAQEKLRCDVCKKALTLSNRLQCRKCREWTCLAHRLDHQCKPGLRSGGGVMQFLLNTQARKEARGWTNLLTRAAPE